jgi:tetratricopeptide (TPR) repeat protein
MKFRTAVFALLLISPAVAQEAKDSASTSIEVAKPAPIDKVKQRSAEIDKLFGLLHQEDFGNAETTISKIWTLWESNESPTAELLLTQSSKAMKDGAFETSEQMLNTLLGTWPDYVEALSKRAMLYYNMKRYDDAMTDINAVLDTEPRHFGALSGRAAVLMAQGDIRGAASSLREAIAVNPYLESAKMVLKQLEHDYPDI